MIGGSLLIGLALAYISVLFVVAWFGDRWPNLRSNARGRPILYALSIGVYCTSWTFFGSVGSASATGYDFLPVYTGPVLLFMFGSRILRRIVRLARNQNLTSVADFLAARYGKSQIVAATATVIAVVATLPYIALQLKAVSVSVDTVLGLTAWAPTSVPVDTALIVAAVLATFAILFGTRHADATEHQHGLMLAIATESLVKLGAFLAVGAFIAYVVFVEPATTTHAPALRVAAFHQLASLLDQPLHTSVWVTVTVLSFFAVVLLPRQFHVIVVENNAPGEIKRAAWMFPLYLVLINLFVVPIAAAGLMRLPDTVPPDTFVLALPLHLGAPVMTMIAFIGGLSAATAMVVLDSVALALMVCNGLVAPVLLRSFYGTTSDHTNMVRALLSIRRTAIVVIIAASYGFYRLVNDAALASIGLVSFAGIAQLAPAFFIGLGWRRATSTGALAGMIAGIAVWAYTLVLPWFAHAGLVDHALMTNGPFGLRLLEPQSLFFLKTDPLTHGVFWSLFANVSCVVAFSLIRRPNGLEQLQAHVFAIDTLGRPAEQPSFRRWSTAITAADLQATAARYLGRERVERAFAAHGKVRKSAIDPSSAADADLVAFTEHLLTSAIGAASARLVMTLLLRRGSIGPASTMQLLDDAQEALQHNRDLLQSALDQVQHGLSVFDSDMRLVCWNKQFRELLDLPMELGRFGVPLSQILRQCAQRGDFGQGRVDDLVAERVRKMANRNEAFQEKVHEGRRILEIRSVPMPQGGFVATYIDITERVAASDAMNRLNEQLERRVAHRTAELSRANTALGRAKAVAESASADKTRFLAAASHDIMQPLNAARLYSSSLIEQQKDTTARVIAGKIDQSLSAVEEIIGAVIEIARLDTGRIEAEFTAMPVQGLLDRLRVEFEPIAREKGLTLHIVPCSLWVRSDRRLLPRLMQNLVSNAVKYTPKGTVLVGARRRPYGVTLQVWDTGPGIPGGKLSDIFKEFQRLPETATTVAGLGLGLSIVERIAKSLDHRVDVTSEVGKGTVFAVTAPAAAAGRQDDTDQNESEAPQNQLAGLVAVCIDNDPVVLEGMTTLLGGWGCAVLAARNTTDMRDLLARDGRTPDVVIADYHLDGETGIDAIRAVREQTKRAVPALVVTADTSNELQRAVRASGLGLLRKPVKVAALRAALTHASRQSEAATAAAE